MNMQQLMMQAQKMQRDMQKKQKELEAKTFHIESAGGAITIDIKGTRQIEKIEIDEEVVQNLMNQINQLQNLDDETIQQIQNVLSEYGVTQAQIDALFENLE